VKKNWVPVLSIVVGEVLFWAFHDARDYYWLLSLAGVVAVFVFAVRIIRSTKRSEAKPAARWITYLLCAAVIAGQIYALLWMRSQISYPMRQLAFVAAEQANDNRCHVTLKSADGKTYNILFSAEDTERLRAAQGGISEVFITTHALWPDCTTGEIPKEQQP
jgi:hypothetical protein